MEEIKDEIENILNELNEAARRPCICSNFLKNFEGYIYYIAEFCLPLKEWAFFSNNYKYETHNPNDLMFDSVMTNTKQLLEFVKYSLNSFCIVEGESSNPDHAIFNSIYCIDKLTRDENRELDIDLTFLREEDRKKFPGKLLFSNNFSSKFEEMEMVVNSIDANNINPISFLDKTELDCLRFIYQNLKNIHAIWSLPDYTETTFLQKK